MLGWLGFLGKLFEFAATKILGWRIDLRLDQKKSACKDLIEFYELVLELEALCAVGVDILEPVALREKARLYPRAAKELSEKATSLSHSFLSRLPHLIRALEILDPALAVLLSDIARGKLARLNPQRLSKVFEAAAREPKLERRDGIGFVLRFHVPSDFPEAQLEDLYSALYRKLPVPLESIDDESRLLVGNDHPDLLSGLLPPEQVREVELFPEDYEAIRALHSDLKRHLETLHGVRTALRTFIASRFSLEDLLYTTSSK